MSAKKPQASSEKAVSLSFSGMVLAVRGVEGVDEMDEHKDRWLPLPPVGAEASSYGDVENNGAEWDAVDETVELPSRETRLAYRCRDLKFPHPFLNSALRGVRKIFPLVESSCSEMTRVDSDGSFATLDRGLLLLCPALWGTDLGLLLQNLAMVVL
jgi:hypothetical protein